MAISFVSEAHGVADYNASLSVSLPTGAADGDLLVAFIACDRSGGIPSGWTQLGTADSGTTSMGSAYVYYKIANSEGSSYSFTKSSSPGIQGTGAILCYRGIDQTTPIDLTDFDISAVGTGTNYNTASVTADGTQWAVSGAACYEFNSSSDRTWSEGGSPSERCDFSVHNTSSPDNSNMEVCDSNGAVSAGSFSRTQTRSAFTGSGGGGVKFILLLNPPSAIAPIMPTIFGTVY